MLYAAAVLENPDSTIMKAWHVENRSHSARTEAMEDVELNLGWMGAKGEGTSCAHNATQVTLNAFPYDVQYKTKAMRLLGECGMDRGQRGAHKMHKWYNKSARLLPSQHYPRQKDSPQPLNHQVQSKRSIGMHATPTIQYGSWETSLQYGTFDIPSTVEYTECTHFSTLDSVYPLQHRTFYLHTTVQHCTVLYTQHTQ